MRNINSTGTVDPNTLNLDPETEFWSNLDPDPRVNLSILKNVKASFRANKCSYQLNFFFIKTKLPV